VRKNTKFTEAYFFGGGENLPQHLNEHIMSNMKNYTKEQIEAAIKISKSWSGVMRVLNPNAVYVGCQSSIKKTAQKMKIDFSHFTGNAWNRGFKFPASIPIEDYFNGLRKIRSNPLKNRILKENIKEWKCEKCQNTEWLGQKIPLELHHIDSNPKNNRLENLKLVCPNCHYREHNPTDKPIVDKPIFKKEKPVKLPKIKEPRTKKPPIACAACGKLSQGKHCSYACKATAKRKVIRPAKEKLEEMVKCNSLLQIGKIYGVSDNAIRKWAKQYKINLSNTKFSKKKT